MGPGHPSSARSQRMRWSAARPRNGSEQHSLPALARMGRPLVSGGMWGGFAVTVSCVRRIVPAVSAHIAASRTEGDERFADSDIYTV